MLVKQQQDGCSCLPLLQFCFKLAYTLQTLWLGFVVRILVAQLTLSIYVHANKTRLECVVGILTMCMCKELRERLGVDDIALILQQNRLRWYGHVLRKDDDDWVKKCM